MTRWCGWMVFQRLLLPGDDEAQTAYREVVKLLQSAKDSGVPASCISFDPTLARGLNYYTGAIFEVRVKDAPGRKYLRRWALCEFDRDFLVGRA